MLCSPYIHLWTASTLLASCTADLAWQSFLTWCKTGAGADDCLCRLADATCRQEVRPWCIECAGTSSQRAWQVSLREYAAAGPSARLRMLLSPADDPEVEADRGILRALLQGLSAEERTAKSAGIMGNLAADRLPWCASLFRAECFRLQVRWQLPCYHMMCVLVSCFNPKPPIWLKRTAAHEQQNSPCA